MHIPIGLATAYPAAAMPTPRRDDMGEHRALLQFIARGLCRNDATADDLVQDTFERALRAADRYDDRGNLRSWLIVILHNLFIDRCRKAKRSPELEYLDTIEVPVPREPIAPWANVTSAQVTAAVSRLRPEFRSVFELHVAGRSYQEIAVELQIAKSSVGTRLLRARRKLKAALIAAQEGAPP